MLRAAVLAVVLAAGPAALAEGSHFTVALAGGALLPQGEMNATIDAGLDVWGRFGWTAKNGLGLVLNLEYAPLRRSPESLPAGEAIDSQLFAAQAAPRFTLGRHAVRLWLAAGGGVLVDRTATTTTASATTAVRVDTAFTVGGQGGLDFFLFDNGGLTLAGGYTRGLGSTGAGFDYVSLNAGLMFSL